MAAECCVCVCVCVFVCLCVCLCVDWQGNLAMAGAKPFHNMGRLAKDIMQSGVSEGLCFVCMCVCYCSISLRQRQWTTWQGIPPRTHD